MYADDTSLLFTGTDPKSLQSDMNNALSKIASWFDSNMLTLDTKKTKFMVYGTTHLLSRFCNVSVTYGDQVIERVNKFKYLGVVLDPMLTWCEHVDYISSVISKHIGVIRRVKFYLPCTTLNMLANALIFPYFDYCSPVWSNCNLKFSNILQILQNKLARVLLSADIRTPVDNLLWDLNWIKLEVAHHKKNLAQPYFAYWP